MKGFLLLFSTIFLNIPFLVVSIILPVINQIQISKTGLQNWHVINWFEDGSAWKRQSNYSDSINYAYFIKTINIGKFDILKYKTVSLLDPIMESFARTSWGNNTYYGSFLVEKINNVSIKKIFSHNQKIVTNADINNYLTIELLNKMQSFFKISSMHTSHYVGFSYYTENGNNYIQVFIKQYVAIFHSNVGGVMCTNVGRGLIFYL